jgi:DNA (cytosine-5)-methyltransferase 1
MVTRVFFYIVNNTTNLLDLFCGAGGFTEGFSRAGFKIIAGVDKDKKAVETFNNNQEADAHNIDLSMVSGEDLLDRLGFEKENIDGIIGGPPCQGFSQAGKRNPNDERNDLVINYFDIIEHIQPEFFVMENVRAITFDRNNHIIDYIENRLERANYSYLYDTLNAANFGVPQTRKRLFIVGSKNREPHLPDPELEENSWVGLNDVIDVPEGQIVSSYGTQETLRGERNTRDTDQPSYTLRATRCLVDIIPNDYNPPEDDGEIPSISDVRIYRFDEQDAKIVQSFPRDYDFTGNKTEQRKQIGNAVPPDLSESIAKEISENFDIGGC